MIDSQNIKMWACISFIVMFQAIFILPWLTSYISQLFWKKQAKKLEELDCYNCAYSRIDKITEGMSQLTCMYRSPCKHKEQSNQMVTVTTTGGDCVNMEQFKQKVTKREME